MYKNKYLVFAALLFAVIFMASSGSAFAKCKKSHHDGARHEKYDKHKKCDKHKKHDSRCKDKHYGDHFSKVVSSLDLTDEQEGKVKALKSDYKKKTVMMEAELEVLALELTELLHADSVDLKDVRAKLEQKFDKKIDLKMYRFQTFEDLKEILTKEQKAQLKKAMRSGKHGKYDKKQCKTKYKDRDKDKDD